jgi:hypothetical protein
MMGLRSPSKNKIGAKFCENVKNRNKKGNILSEYFLFVKILKNCQISGEENFGKFSPHLAFDFSLVAFF